MQRKSMSDNRKKSFSEKILAQKDTEASIDMVNDTITQEIDYFIDLCSEAASKQLGKEESLIWIEEKLRERRRAAGRRGGKALQ